MKGEIPADLNWPGVDMLQQIPDDRCCFIVDLVKAGVRPKVPDGGRILGPQSVRRSNRGGRIVGWVPDADHSYRNSSFLSTG